MPINPYIVLGIDENATQNEVEEAYQEKKAKYSKLIFEEGEVGADAARQLERIESAYEQIMETIREGEVDAKESTADVDYTQIKQLIKDKDPDGAQSLLDDISYRDGEWHYYQSVVYYQKSWLMDSKTQLEIALQLDPNNAKYKKALDNLNHKISGENPFKNQQTQQSEQTTQQQPDNRTYTQATGTDPVADSICSVCQTLVCADCCCECMGGDFISCC